MPLSTTTLTITLIAILAEAGFGYPNWLFARIGHPVTWIGRLISWLDRSLNGHHLTFGNRRRQGALALAVILLVPISLAIALQMGLNAILAGLAVLPLGVLASSLFAQRSLYDHVARVADGLDVSLEEGRKAVAQIVGRDPQSLDEAAVARAAIESLAENFSDGIVAPVFYTAIGGLAGGVAYKAINTADSMIGHRTPRHEAFGWAAARLDDWVNLPASRLSALFIVLAASLTKDHPREAIKAVRRDARHHRSPNAGWPEAAMAGALGLRLAGPRIYGGVPVHDHWMGEGRADVHADDIRAALRLYRAACMMQAGLIATLIVVWWMA